MNMTTARLRRPAGPLDWNQLATPPAGTMSRTWDDVADLLPHRYVEMVAHAGGLPVLLPPTELVADVLLPDWTTA